MFRRFFVYFGPYKKDLWLSVLCTVVESVIELLIPSIMTSMIDVGVAQKDVSLIINRGLLMLGCAAASLLFGHFYSIYTARAGQGFGAELRMAEYAKVESFSFSNMDHFSNASLVTRMTSDVNVMQNAICNGIRPLVRGPVMIIVALFFSYRMSPELTMVFLVAVPVLAISVFLIIRKLAPLYSRTQKALESVNRVVRENINAIQVVKAYVRGDYEAEKFAEVNAEYRQASEKAYHYAVMNMPMLQTVMYATSTALVWFGGNLIFDGKLQIGQLTGCLSYVLQILNGLMMFSGVFLLLTRSTTSAKRIAEVLDEPVDIADDPIEKARVTKGDIKFQNVGFKYVADAAEYVMEDVDLHFLPGQVVGIVGGTGSSKTSLVQLIPRLYDVSKGAVLVDGVDVRDYSVVHLRDAVGMVLQKNTLFSGTIRENLQWGDEKADDEELDWACHIAAADEFIPRLAKGYDTMLGQGGSGLSGGQRQRVCIARAILKKPKILILDDSTSAVDTKTDADIRKRLAHSLPETTKIIIAQRISSVEDADQIVVMDRGRIVGIGTHDILVERNEIYREMVHSQEKGAIEE